MRRPTQGGAERSLASTANRGALLKEPPQVGGVNPRVGLQRTHRPVAPVRHCRIGRRGAVRELGPAAVAGVQDALQLPQGLAPHQGDLGHANGVAAAVAAFASFGAQADEADASQFATKFETNRTRAEVIAEAATAVQMRSQEPAGSRVVTYKSTADRAAVRAEAAAQAMRTGRVGPAEGG